MTGSEFALIEKYFASPAVTRADVSLGSGDDCALLEVPPGRQLAVTMDTLVAGRHYLPQTDPWRLGWKVLAVNLSDLAAMGAEPAWATLPLTLPQVDKDWLRAFVDGFGALAAIHDVQLVGGDMTRGPLSITVQVHGFVDPLLALRRSGARAGDRLLVSTENNGTRLYDFDRSGKIVPEPAVSTYRLAPDTSTPVLVGDRLYCVSRGLYCLDVRQGLNMLWKQADRAFHRGLQG